MKKAFVIFTILAATFASCKKTTTTEPTKPTYIGISADKNGVFSNGQDAITFEATLPDNTVITNEVEFYVEGEKIAGNSYTSSVAGEYTAYAIYDDVKSGDLKFGVVDKVESPSSYSTKILVEDYTGAWCGWCPRVAYKLEEAVKANANIIPVGVHYGDVLGYTYVNEMMTKYNITGFPTALLNRSAIWTEKQIDLDNLLGNHARIGLAISSVQNGQNLDVNVKVGFTISTKTELKLVVYLLEDGILEDQANYMNNETGGAWYQAGDPIKDFEHNNVLRSSLTDIFGDDIPQYVTLERNTYSTNYSIDISKYNMDKMHLVAFVMSTTGGTYVYNVQSAKAGSTVDFD